MHSLRAILGLHETRERVEACKAKHAVPDLHIRIAHAGP